MHHFRNILVAIDGDGGWGLFAAGALARITGTVYGFRVVGA